MKDKTQFLEKLNELVNTIRKNGNEVTTFEVKEYFSNTDLTEEQMELVYDYLLAQKVVVKGYINIEAKEIELTEEEKAYLADFSQEISSIKEASDEEKEQVIKLAVQGDQAAKSRVIELYLKEVQRIATDMHDGQVFLGDLIEEGTIGLVRGTEALQDVNSAHEIILSYIEKEIQFEIERQKELHNQDRQMVEKVQMLDDAITNLTEELGHKVTLEELAVYLGMTESEVISILKLAGEDVEE